MSTELCSSIPNLITIDTRPVKPEHYGTLQMSTPLVNPVAESCPLCPPSGPPVPRSIASDTIKTELSPGEDHPRTKGIVPTIAEEGPDKFVWIGCTHCATWFHSICILQGDHEAKATVPDVVMEEIKRNHPEEGVWFDWTKWMNRWYVPDRLRLPKTPSCLCIAGIAQTA